jgi:hypothetical protein
MNRASSILAASILFVVAGLLPAWALHLQGQTDLLAIFTYAAIIFAISAILFYALSRDLKPS